MRVHKHGPMQISKRERAEKAQKHISVRAPGSRTQTSDHLMEEQGQRGHRSLALVYSNDNDAPETNPASKAKLSPKTHTHTVSQTGADSKHSHLNVFYVKPSRRKKLSVFNCCHLTSNLVVSVQLSRQYCLPARWRHCSIHFTTC